VSEHDPFTVEDVKERREIILKRYAERKRGDVQRILSTVEGRRFLWRLLVEAKIHSTCFDTNALTMAMNEGRRDIGLFVENEILLARPEALEQMRNEAVSDRLIRETELLKTEKGESNG
jgi:hypothetical protein